MITSGFVAVLDLFLKLIDRVIELVKEHKKGRRELFDEVVAPLFEDVQPVVDDYIKFLLMIQDMCADDEIALSRIVSETRRRRGEQRAARIKLSEMASAICEHINDEDIEAFCVALASIFVARRIDRQLKKADHENTLVQSNYARSVRVVRALEEMESGGIGREQAAREIDNVLEYIRRQWMETARIYSVLRIKAISPRLSSDLTRPISRPAAHDEDPSESTQGSHSPRWVLKREGDPVEKRVRYPLLVGRDDLCDVQLKERTVSRFHAIIFEHNGQVFVRDLESSNGVLINGRRATPNRVSAAPEGSRIVFGDHSFTFTVERRGSDT